MVCYLVFAGAKNPPQLGARRARGRAAWLRARFDRARSRCGRRALGSPCSRSPGCGRSRDASRARDRRAPGRRARGRLPEPRGRADRLPGLVDKIGRLVPGLKGSLGWIADLRHRTGERLCRADPGLPAPPRNGRVRPTLSIASGALARSRARRLASRGGKRNQV